MAGLLSNLGTTLGNNWDNSVEQFKNMRTKDGFNNFMSDPMAQVGMSILANTDGRSNPIGRGINQGMNNTVRMRNNVAQQQQRQQLFDQQQAQQQAAQAKAQQQQAWMRQNMPQMQHAPAGLRAEAYKAQFRAPKAPTAFDQKMELLQNDPKTFSKMFPPKTPLVTVGNKLRNVEDQIQLDTQLGRAKEAITSNKQWLAAGAQARPDIRRYEKILGLLDQTETGTFAETKVNMVKLAQGLGMDINVNKAASSEELMVLMGDEVMGRIAQTKGAVSEREMKLFEQFAASFGKTTEGNRKIIKYKLAQSKRNEDVAKLVRDARRKGVGAINIDRAVFDYINAPENDLSTYLQQSEGSESEAIDNLLENQL